MKRIIKCHCQCLLWTLFRLIIFLICYPVLWFYLPNISLVNKSFETYGSIYLKVQHIWRMLVRFQLFGYWTLFYVLNFLLGGEVKKYYLSFCSFRRVCRQNCHGTQTLPQARGKVWRGERCDLEKCCMFSFQVSAVDSLEGPLLQVEGLSDLRLELHSKKMNMHLVLIDELHRHLYIKSTNRVGQRNKEKGRIRLVWRDANSGQEV